MLGLVLRDAAAAVHRARDGSPLAAAGTNIAISAAAAGAGGLRHAREGRVDWRVVSWIAFPSAAGAVAGALLADDVSESLLYWPDRRRAPLERDRPGAQADPRLGHSARLRLGRGSALSSCHRRCSAAPLA